MMEKIKQSFRNPNDTRPWWFLLIILLIIYILIHTVSAGVETFQNKTYSESGLSTINVIDYKKADIDTHSFTTANMTFDSFHTWFYGVIVACCAIVTLWFFMVVIAKVQYRRQEQMMYANYPYNPGWGLRPR